MFDILYWFLIFFLFSVIGYFAEVIYCLIKDHELVNRGFMFGPYCPIYGLGSICTILLLKKYNTDPMIIFVFGTIICTIIEYYTSFLLEKVFKNKWWDYSKYKYNINGRVCLKNSILFGLGCLSVEFVFYPLINKIIISTNNTIIVFVSLVFFILFVVDLIFSVISATKLKQQLRIISEMKSRFKIKMPSLLEINAKKALSKYKSYPKHLINAFPNIKIFHKDSIKLIQKSIDKKRSIDK